MSLLEHCVARYYSGGFGVVFVLLMFTPFFLPSKFCVFRSEASAATTDDELTSAFDFETFDLSSIKTEDRS